MAKLSKSLQLMALKLGLTEEDKVLSKASEFERLLQMKSSVSNITDAAKIVICLDLAASYLNVGVDLKTAVKCSGLKTPSYTNCRKILENILDLNNDKVTVSSLCLTLQCNVEDLAQRILEEYSKTVKMDLDVNLPQYICMAVHHACRLSKVKVPKSKLMEKCQLKPAQWAKLDAEWTKFTDDKFAVAKKKRGRPAKVSGSDVEKMEIDCEVADKKDEQQSELTAEPYEEWKRRILEEAYKQIEQEKPKQNHTKRKESKQNDNNVEVHKENQLKVNDRILEKAYKRIEQESPKQYHNKRKESKQNDIDNEAVHKGNQMKLKDRILEEDFEQESPKHYRNKRKESERNDIKDVNGKQLKLKDRTLNYNQIDEESPKQYHTQRKESKQKDNDVDKGNELKVNDRIVDEAYKNIEQEKPKQYHNKRKVFKQNDNVTQKEQLKVNESPTKEFVVNFSPRRSPRKTPQKFEPYKSPVKPKGVRLLFPL